MMNKQILGIAVVLAAAGGMLFYFFQDEALDEDEPLEFFKNHQYVEALQSLEKNRKAYKQDEYVLQKSYILRELGNEQEAQRSLLQVIQSGSSSSNLLFEAYLNLMLNAYLNHDIELLKEHLINVQHLTYQDSQWFSLFMGTVFYHEGNSSKVLEALSVSSADGYLSPWMEQRFSPIFDSRWYAKHDIHSQIGVGNIREARAKLEKIKTLFSPDHMDEYHYLYGLTYIIDAKRKPYDEAIPDYRLATRYISSMSDPLMIKQQKELLAAGLKGHIQQIFEEQDFVHLPFYVVNIEKWGEEENVQEVKDHLVLILDQELWNGQDAQLAQLVETLSLLLKDCRVRNEVGLRFESLLEIAIQKNETQLLETYWKMILAFRNENEILNGKFSDLAVQKVFQTIISDNAALNETEKYLNFYLIVEEKDEDALYLSNNLVMIAARFWEIPQQREKAIHLLKAAKKVAPGPFAGDVQAKIEEMFRYRYSHALRQDTVSELLDLVNAVEVLEVASVDVNNRQELQQQLEDAEYLYLQGRLTEAQKKAEWVLAVDPGNLRARRLLGMVFYYFADYQKADKFLKGIPPANDEMREAHAVVAILSGNEVQGRLWLKEVQQNRSIQENIYLRLVYGFLVNREPVEALDWLVNVPESHPEVLPAKVFAAFQLNSWRETIDLANQLDPPYKYLDGYEGIVVDSLTALGDVQKAEKVLDQLLRRSPQPADSNFPPYFQAFKRRILDQWNRFFVAGLYFKIVRNDPENALRYFDKIDNPSLLAQVEKAEVYFELGRLHEAKELMLKIDDEITEDQLEIKLRILPLLGKGFVVLGYYVESIPFYQEYFKLKPDDAQYRYPYIRVLMHLKRYDLALEQIKLLKELRALTPEEMIAWMKSLLHQGEFYSVDKQANQWLLTQEVPLFQRLQLARMMTVTKNQPLLDYIINEIPGPSRLSIDDNQELILLWMDLGDYTQALDLAQLLEKDLIKTQEGLMVLARLYMKLSRVQDSHSYTEKVLQINPTNVDALEFIESYDQRAEVMASLVKLLKERIEENPNNVTLHIDYAKNLIELAMDAYLSGAEKNLNDSIDLQQARLILEKLKEKKPDLPEVYLLLGKVYYLLGQSERSKKEFEKSVKFDPSYIEALQHLSLVYEENEQFDQALATINDAARFAPTHADVWEQLGNLSVVSRDWKQAINAYQSSIRFAPFDSDPYLRLASTYIAVKKPANAVNTLQVLLSFSPESTAGLSLMLQALYDPVYVKQNKDSKHLQSVRIDYYDRLRILDPDLAKKSLPQGVTLEPE